MHPGLSLGPGDGPIGIEITVEGKPFLEVAQQALGLNHLRGIQTGGYSYSYSYSYSYEAGRERWDDGNNLLAIEPGVVIGYARNA